ncbi:XdhC family protein [Neorhizobium tomejilense]|uniref:XdhC family protein n=1 Tax=Neorhizobium tomejilense TaxID=2093828 RepID=UPI003ECDBE30
MFMTDTAAIYPDWPMFGIRENVLQFALAHLIAGADVAIATLIHTDGGSPRPPGTQMAFTDDNMTGFLSRGCIEADVALHAKATLLDGEPRKLIYGRGSQFGDASVTIAIERMRPTDPVAENLMNMAARREDIILISDGEERIAASRPHDFGPRWLKFAEQAFSSPRAGGQIDAVHYWVRYRPQVRLFIIGSDPTALAIAQLGKEAEFEIIFVRPLGPSLPPPVAPQVYRPTQPGKVFEEFGLDRRAAVVFANHDFKSNRENIAQALRSQVGYVGMIGAKRQRPLKVDWLKQDGLNDLDIAKFRSPIGISVGKSSPFAIAISVIAEIVCLMSQC